jgi:site-specific recombinase XerC
MKGLTQKALLLAVGVVIMVGAGCQEAEAPSTKKARLIASENMQLKKQLEQRDSEIERLKSEHGRQIKLREEQTAKCLEQNKALQKQLQQDIQERVDEVLAAVVEENARLQDEVSKLKAQIEELKK